MELVVDPDRVGAPLSGFIVRARGPGDQWGPADVSTLDAKSLLIWLRSRGGENAWAENAFAALIGHAKRIVESSDEYPRRVLKSLE